MPSALVLAVTAANAESLLSGERDRDHRRIPPKKLPARAYLAVVGTGSVVGECRLGAAERHTAKGWALPVSQPGCCVCGVAQAQKRASERSGGLARRESMRMGRGLAFRVGARGSACSSARG